MTTTAPTRDERLTALFNRTTSPTLITSLLTLAAVGERASAEERWMHAKIITELERRYPTASDAVEAAFLAAELEMERTGEYVEVDYVGVLVAAIEQAPVTVTVTRFQLVPVPGFGGRPRWSYNYTISGEPMVCQYGPRLGDLRAQLKRKYPTATIVEDWKS